MPLLLRDGIRGSSRASPPLALALRGVGCIVDDLVVDRVVCVAEGGVEYGEEAELCWDDGA